MMMDVVAAVCNRAKFDDEQSLASGGLEGEQMAHSLETALALSRMDHTLTLRTAGRVLPLLGALRSDLTMQSMRRVRNRPVSRLCWCSRNAFAFH